MSLGSFMAGFLPPPLLDTNLPIYWQPYTFDIDYEGRVVHLKFDACPAYVKELSTFQTNPPAEVAAWLAADAEAIKQFSVKLGAPINGLMDVFSVGDSLKTLKGIHPNMPQWAQDGYNNTFKMYRVLIKTMFHQTKSMVKVR